MVVTESTVDVGPEWRTFEREKRVRTAPLMLRFNDGEEDGWDDKEWDDEEDVDVVDDCELWDCTDWFVIEEEDP